MIHCGLHDRICRCGFVLRLIAVCVAAVAAWLPAAAQRHYVPHVHVGVHGGVSLSKQSFFPSVKESMLQGMNFGFSFRYAEERHVGILVELNMEQRGWKEDFEEHPFNFERQLTYIELPIMTHIFFGGRNVKCFFNLGPEVGYMIGDKTTANFDYMAAPNVPDFPSNRRYEQMQLDIHSRFDYGITAGAGVEFIIRKRHSITLEGRYYYGLGNIYPSSKRDTFSASRGSSIQITLGYQFRIK